MADEKTDSTEDGRPSRRRWQVVAVVAAVAVITGGIYGAGALEGDGSGDASDVADDGSGGDAAPLVLDDRPLAQGADRAEGLVLESGLAAPLRPAGELPDGGGSAVDYGFEGGAAREDVAELAALLGLHSSVSQADGWWTVGEGPDGPVLSVQREAPGYWAYTDPATAGEVSALPALPADPGDTSVDSGSGSSSGSGSGSALSESEGEVAPPPSREEALEAAEPLLAELGLSDALVDASRSSGSQRSVLALPRVDGLLVHGLQTEVVVGHDGEVTAAWGARQPEVAPGAEREIVDAGQALTDHNDRVESAEMLRLPQCQTGRGAASGAETVPGADAEPEMPCAEVAKPEPVRVTAELGLALHHSDGEPLLVPSWLFLAADGEDGTPVASHPAVPFEYRPGSDAGSASGAGSGPASGAGSGAASGSGSGGGDDGHGDDGRQDDGGGVVGAEPAEPEAGAGSDVSETGLAVESYEASGRTLTVTFWGGVCGDHVATAEESDERVVVRVEATSPDPDTQCIALAEQMTTEVELAEPVGDRSVVDGRGEPITVR
ncbi:hypothetical protein ACTWP5_19410 [Streptomyces sp. 4N509B]|uniref:hypothetical protein n=1 Tax=Streptomyces sp. 4N509B TaxID=3457413 RepID=UPI003FD33615